MNHLKKKRVDIVLDLLDGKMAQLTVVHFFCESVGCDERNIQQLTAEA